MTTSQMKGLHKNTFQMQESTILSPWYRNYLWVDYYILLLSAFVGPPCCHTILFNQKCHAYKLIHLPLTLAPDNYYSTLCFHEVGYFIVCILSDIMKCLSVCVQLISPSIMSFKFIHIFTNGKVFLFLRVEYHLFMFYIFLLYFL